MPEQAVVAAAQAVLAAPSPYLVLKHAQAQFGLTPAALSPEQQQRVLRIAAEQQRIEARVLSTPQAARVIVSRGSVDACVATIRARYANELEFMRALGAQGLSLAELREEMARDLQVEAVLDLVSASVTPISALEVEIFYRLHAARLQQPERRRVRHLLITLNEAIPENTRLAAQARMRDILAQCAGQPARFAALALRHSECPSATTGGLIGEVPAGQLFPALDAALFKMQAGEISSVIESPMGLHILLCEAILPAASMPLSKLRQRIREQMLAARRARIQRAWLQQLMALRT